MLYSDCTYADREEVAAIYGADAPEAWIRTNLVDQYERLAELIPLKPSACPESQTNCTLMDRPNSWTGGYWSTWTGSWVDAAHMVTVLQTQFVNGNAVYKNLTSEEISSLFQIATSEWMSYKNAINARRFAGPNYAAYIISEMHKGFRLQDGMANKITWLMAHDVNVAFAETLLSSGLNTFSYPAHGGSSIFVGALILEVHSSQTPWGYTVQAFQQASTMEQIRSLDVEDMIRSRIPIAWCSRPLDCPIDEFYDYVQAWINRRCIAPQFQTYLDQNPQWAAWSASYAAKPTLLLFVLFATMGALRFH